MKTTSKPMNPEHIIKAKDDATSLCESLRLAHREAVQQGEDFAAELIFQSLENAGKLRSRIVNLANISEQGERE